MTMKLLPLRRALPSIRTLTARAIHTDSRSSSPPEPPTTKTPAAKATPKKTIAQLDEEMRLKMEGISGDGGASGVEYEDGKAEGLKRGVKSNMFRVI